MTLNDLNSTIRTVLAALDLSGGSFRRGSAYHDYVAVEFATFATDEAMRVVASRFRQLCDSHRWACCDVTRRNDCSIMVTMHQHEAISTESRPMPRA